MHAGVNIGSRRSRFRHIVLAFPSVLQHQQRRRTMRACLQALMVGVVLGAGTLTLWAQPDNPRMGTWNLNVAKSTYSPGPAPKSQVLRIEAVGDGEKVTSEIAAADGTKATTVYTANYDGKDYPITGSLTADTVSLKRNDRHTTVRTDKKGGKVVQTLTRVVSKDGKTMTVTIKGTNASGQPMNNVVVFEKK
jgi:hypothetical protein